MAGTSNFGNKKRSKLASWVLLGTVVFGLATSMMGLLLGAAATVLLPAAPFAAAWDRVTSLFSDNDWKQQVKAVSTYQFPTDHEDLLLYKSLWVDGKPVEVSDVAHWLNYGRLDKYLYKVLPGKHSIMVDIGRETPVSKFQVLLACKSCAFNSYYLPEPLDEHTHQPIPTSTIAALYAPGGSQFTVSDSSPKQRWATVSATGDDSNPQAPLGARYFMFELDNGDVDCYLSQILAFPIGPRSNVLWAGQPTFDVRYRNLYDGRIVAGLGPTNPAGSDPFGQRFVHDETITPTLSYFHPLVDSNQHTYTTIYPVVGPASDPQPGDGSCFDANTGYLPVYLEWKLPSEAVGKLDNLELDWLVGSNYAGATAPFGGTAAGNSGANHAPFSKGWSVYLFNSTKPSDANLLKTLFDPASPARSLPDIAVLTPYLVKQLTAAIPNNGLSDSGEFGLPKSDRHDTVVVAFTASSYRAPHPAPVFFPDPMPMPTPTPTPTPTPLPGATPGPTPTPTGQLRDLCDPANASYVTPQNKPGPPTAWPNQLSGLPVDWLSVAEVKGFEQKPPTPEVWPLEVTNTGTSTGSAFIGNGGAYDLRFGNCSAATIEGIIAQHPWHGIALGGGQAGLPASANKLSGLGTFFITMGQKYSLNPCYAVAWSLKETQLGTTGFHVYNASTGEWGYNLYGMTGTGWVTGLCIPGMNGRFCGYRNWQDSIEDFFGLLSQGYVQGQSSFVSHDGQGQGEKACPCATVERILPWYAPYFENDTDLYIHQVKSWISEWGAAAPAMANSSVGSITNTSGIMGKVPYLSQLDRTQYDNDSQFVAYKQSTCGIASATMVINSLGFQLNIGSVLDTAVANGSISSSDGTLNWRYITSGQMQGLGAALDLHTFISDNTDDYLREFRTLTAQGEPVIANVLDSYYYAGHFFVVTGYDSSDDTYIVNDPYGRNLPGNPAGPPQKWPGARLGSILRLGYPAIIITRIGDTTSPKPILSLFKYPDPADGGGGGGGNNNNPTNGQLTLLEIALLDPTNKRKSGQLSVDNFSQAATAADYTSAQGRLI